jgi:hypothetical protein
MSKVRCLSIYVDVKILIFCRHVRTHTHMCLARASRHANLKYDTIFFPGTTYSLINFLEYNKYQVQYLAIDGGRALSRDDVTDLTEALRRCKGLRDIIFVPYQGGQARNECQLKRFSVSFVELGRLKLTGTDGEQLEIKALLNKCIPQGLYDSPVDEEL